MASSTVTGSGAQRENVDSDKVVMRRDSIRGEAFSIIAALIPVNGRCTKRRLAPWTAPACMKTLVPRAALWTQLRSHPEEQHVQLAVIALARPQLINLHIKAGPVRRRKERRVRKGRGMWGSSLLPVFPISRLHIRLSCQDKPGNSSASSRSRPSSLDKSETASILKKANL